MTMQMRKQISTLEAGQQELFKKNEGAMEELRRANAALKQEIDALKREKESFLEDIFKKDCSIKVLMENQSGGGIRSEGSVRERNQHLKEELEAKGKLLSKQFELNIKYEQLLQETVEFAKKHNASKELIDIFTHNAQTVSAANLSMEGFENEMGRSRRSSQRSWSDAARTSFASFKGWLG